MDIGRLERGCLELVRGSDGSATMECDLIQETFVLGNEVGLVRREVVLVADFLSSAMNWSDDVFEALL